MNMIINKVLKKIYFCKSIVKETISLEVVIMFLSLFHRKAIRDSFDRVIDKYYS